MGGRFGRCLVRLRKGFGNAFDFDRIACVVDEGHLAWFCRSNVLIALGQRCNTSGQTAALSIRVPFFMMLSERRSISSFALPLVQNVRAVFFVGGPIAVSYGPESVVFVELSSGVVALKCIESDRRWQLALGMVQKGGADAAASLRGEQVELIHPTTLIS